MVSSLPAFGGKGQGARTCRKENIVQRAARSQFIDKIGHLYLKRALSLLSSLPLPLFHFLRPARPWFCMRNERIRLEGPKMAIFSIPNLFRCHTFCLYKKRVRHVTGSPEHPYPTSTHIHTHTHIPVHLHTPIRAIDFCSHKLN